MRLVKIRYICVYIYIYEICLLILKLKFSLVSELLNTQETVTWILQNLNKRWRDWKGDLKAEFYIPKAKEQVLVAPPSIVLEEQWPGLVRQWYNPRNEVTCISFT